MNKTMTRLSAARRSAEAILNQSRKRQESFKLEQQRESDATAEKTARLRALRLAKEAAEAEPAPAPKAKPPRVRRSKQT